MLLESSTEPAGSLALRAEVAMLTLQVRSAEQEAADAEAALANFDPATAEVSVDELLDPLVVRRRRELDAEFNVVRRTAALEIAAAHRQVAEASASRVAAAGFDPDAFARVLASSFARAINERVPSEVIAPVRRKKFWAHAKHIDVLLIAAATVIVGVVLAAWMV